MIEAEFLIRDLPDPDSARRFLAQLSEKNTSASKKLLSNDALLSDVLLLVSYSPLIASTLLQHPEYLGWLDRERLDSSVRETPELLESLARFSLTNSQVEPHVVLSRFKKRELIRAFLRDIRRLATIAEITEEISNLADAILEHALRLARQELDNRFGQPLAMDEKGRSVPAEFCIVSLGKLGSKELNYSSDIDLLFIYSAEGTTSGVGAAGSVTNAEYFSKLSETIVRLVGRQGGEGAAYRVDMRLRPRGRVGPLAISLPDAVRYYNEEAAAWERQVLIRSRSSAGSSRIFKQFYSKIESCVYDRSETVEDALENVRASKYKIDIEHRSQGGFNVKLGVGGIREIEFIAQALQLAYGGRDQWLRCPHTLICLSRLADRGHILRSELTQVFDAYAFLRGTEHILQMENGLQTHTIPSDGSRRRLLASKLGFVDADLFDAAVTRHTGNVNRTFRRVFGIEESPASGDPPSVELECEATPAARHDANAFDIERLKSTSRRAAEMLSANPKLIDTIGNIGVGFPNRDYAQLLLDAVNKFSDFRDAIGALRREWTRLMFEIIVFDVFEKISLSECKRLQTELAEASLDAAILITRRELGRRYKITIDHLPLAVLGLGKLGGGGLDYDSDLDLVMIYNAVQKPDREGGLTLPDGLNDPEFFSRAVEIFTNALSSITREGTLYRVDLRLRPYGSKGTLAISAYAMLEYMRSTAEVWELLAFVMLRFVGGDLALGEPLAAELRNAIFERASQFSNEELADETRRVRLALEKQRAKTRRSKDVDIKYGAGGLLDVYFVTRFLQLRDRVLSDSSDRSTTATLDRLADTLQKPAGEQGRKTELDDHAFSEALNSLRNGYGFLSALDHNLRLTVGRTSRIPDANQHALEVIATRMDLSSTNEIFDQLTLHRLAIRSAFDAIVGDSNLDLSSDNS